ncbi:hypothetical protein J7E88_29130 [Streptomyces sp. ISL-10]|uniref:hypothetical protein n=1 Tax=Streptomyces sp. ISL-10 TaxID=2819172 RepID=UPI001BEB88BA|nr:hypothetical protein [Streptomyces sp. ISL-10]MBT2369269.1 hypothetical protein [Streptomyces sp. ISL-10]
MSEITGTAKVHEAYAFACMRCGYGWEQSYEIEHHVDNTGQGFVVYKADGQRVPSPLSSPTCVNCGGHVVRIMQAGQVSSAHGPEHERQGGAHVVRTPVSITGPFPGWDVPRAHADTPVKETSEAGSTKADAQADAPAAESHHRWHPSRLLHPFHHRK